MPNNMYMPFVDVRDVAKAHLLGIKKPEAANKRYILCANTLTLFEMFEPLMNKYKQQSWPITEERLPADPNAAMKFDNSASKQLGVNYTDLN